MAKKLKPQTKVKGKSVTVTGKLAKKKGKVALYGSKKVKQI